MVTETADKFDILATVAGGGVSGQAGAVRLGIARALVEYNAELRKQLKTEGLLTRDARAMPSRIAPAWPDTPPPATVARMSNLSAVSVSTRGVRIWVRSASVGKNASKVRSLMRMAPLPGRRKTRAVDVLRRPVP